jgi:formylmethanofuran dehydrogenase subunit C
VLTLVLREQPTVPLEAEVLAPDVLAPLKHADVRALPVYHGKRRLRLDDFFDVEGDGGEDVTIRGELGKVKWIGRGMTRGRVTLHGPVGMHLGAYMTGGAIDVHGTAGDWVGGEMSGGTIRVRGNAGGQVGSAYRGSVTGLSGGTILIEGSAGIEIGMRMRRGTIVVRGPVRDFAGLQMKGGTIVLMDGGEQRTGAWMTRGTIITLRPLRLMPTFAFACDYSPSFLRIYSRHLAGLGFDLPLAGHYRRFTGDAAVPGKGEILQWQPPAT